MKAAFLSFHIRDAGILALAPTRCRESPAAGRGLINPQCHMLVCIALLARDRDLDRDMHLRMGMLTQAASGKEHGGPRQLPQIRLLRF